MNTKKIPNTLSYLRLIMLPVLWIIYIRGSIQYLAVLLLITALTDVFDGYCARKLNLVSKYGSKLDSLADHLLSASAIFWTLNIFPEILQNYALVIILWSLLLIISVLIGLVKFGRIGNLHLYSSKAAAVSSYAFIIYAYLFQFSPALFYISISTLIISAAELIFIQLIHKEVDEHMGSLLLKSDK